MLDGNITGTVTRLHAIAGDVAVLGSISGDVDIVSGIVPTYQGDYDVTPSAETQTLFTEGKMLRQNVVIAPIPSNYGLITWNGAILTVS